MFCLPENIFILLYSVRCLHRLLDSSLPFGSMLLSLCFVVSYENSVLVPVLVLLLGPPCLPHTSNDPVFSLSLSSFRVTCLALATSVRDLQFTKTPARIMERQGTVESELGLEPGAWLSVLQWSGVSQTQRKAWKARQRPVQPWLRAVGGLWWLQEVDSLHPCPCFSL